MSLITANALEGMAVSLLLSGIFNGFSSEERLIEREKRLTAVGQTQEAEG